MNISVVSPEGAEASITPVKGEKRLQTGGKKRRKQQTFCLVEAEVLASKQTKLYLSEARSQVVYSDQNPQSALRLTGAIDTLAPLGLIIIVCSFIIFIYYVQR